MLPASPHGAQFYTAHGIKMQRVMYIRLPVPVDLPHNAK
jgi:hypothetical protein